MALTSPQMQAAIDKFTVNMNRWDALVNGTSLQTVPTDNGNQPTIAKFYEDLRTSIHTDALEFYADELDVAREWAINPEDAPVSEEAGGGPTSFSALHWAKKSLADAIRSENAADTAAIDTANALRAELDAEATRAEVARAGSEAARDIAAGYASDAVSQGNVPIYGTAVGLSALEIPEGINVIRTNGYYAAGGKGGAKYRLMDVGEPTETGELTSNSGTKRWALSKDQVFTPFMFGAIGDGIEDDTIPVQAAVNRKGKIVIGNHFTTVGIKVGSKTHIYGDGSDNCGIHLSVAVNDVPLYTNGELFYSNISLYDFVVDGGYENVDPIQSYHGILMSDVDTLTIRGIHIKSTKEFAALIRRCTRAIITGNRVNVSGINRDGFKLLTCNNVAFTNNIIHSGDDCVSVSAEGGPSENVTIFGNVFKSDFARAVYVNTVQVNPGTARNVSIMGNVIESTDTTAIVVEIYEGEDQIEGIIISSNVFKDFGMSVNNTAGKAWGIRIRGSDSHPIKNVLVANNIFQLKNAPITKDGIGINITWATSVLVSGNIIDFDQELDEVNSSGILIGTDNEPVTDYLVIGNHINLRGNANFGINLVRSSRGTILNNVVMSALASGIHGSGEDNATERCDYVTVRNNTIYDPLGISMQRGIHSENACDYWLVEHNNIRDAVHSFIIALAGTNNTIRRNPGFVTASSGTQSIAAGNVETTVGHNTKITPPLSAITITPTGDIGNAVCLWIDPLSITAGSFKVKCRTAPGGSGAPFKWEVRD
jgi:hypothetical protein